MKQPPLKNTSAGRIAPEILEVLKIIGEESRRNGTDKLTDSQIGKTIKASRKAKKKEKRG